MALSWWDGVTLQVEMAFGEPPTAPTVWTDITADVRDIPGGTVGRRSEFQPFAPSSCVIVLDNASRQYDPDYATGPYFGDLVPMVPCRITATVAATDVDVFYGYVKGWPQEWSRFDATSTITLLDGARFQKNEPLPASVYQALVEADNPSSFWTLQDATETFSDLGTNNRDLIEQVDTFLFVIERSNRDIPVGADQYISSSSSSALSSQTGSFDDPRAIELWAEMELGTGASSTSVLAASTTYMIVRIDFTGMYIQYSNAADNRNLTSLGGFKLAGPLQAGPHHVAMRADTTNLYLIVDGEVIATEALNVGTATYTAFDVASAYVVMNSTGYLSNIAVYEDTTTITNATIIDHYLPGRFAYGHPYRETTGERMERALDDVGWPSALRNIDPGTQVVGPYRPRSRPVLTELRELEATEQGLLFTAEDGRLTFLDRQTLWTTDTGIVFSDDEAANDVRLAGLEPDGNTVDTIRNIVTVSYDQTGAKTRRDATSIAAYGAAAESITSSPMPTAVAASNMAAYVLRSAKDPSTRYTSMTATVRGQDLNTTRILDLIQRRIGDVVTIERLPVNITPRETKKAMIQGYGFRISRQDWTIDYYLSPAVLSSTDAPYLTLGDATYGQIGATAGNLIPA